MTFPRIVVAEALRHCNAWFEDRPFEIIGENTPGTAVERPWEAELTNRFAKQVAVSVNDDSDARWRRLSTPLRDGSDY